MTKSEADRMVRRKHNAPGNKQAVDGWIYEARVSQASGGWSVYRRRKDGMGWQRFRDNAN